MHSSTVMIVDDNPLMRHVVRRLLHPEFVIAASVADGTAALKKAFALNPDIILLDIAMGEPNGFEVARRLRDGGCKARIAFLTVHQNVGYIEAALEIGALAYISKARLTNDLIPALRAVCSGRQFVSKPLPGNGGSDY